MNCMGGGSVIVALLLWNAVDCGFHLWLGQTDDYKIDICCFSTKYTTIRRKSKDCLSRNQDNVF